MSATAQRIIVEVQDPASRDLQLERTCSLLRAQASTCGILVTRITHTTFVVTLSPGVAFGLTYEIDLL